MICESCNKNNKDDVGFCEHCGAALRRTNCSCIPNENYITTDYARLEPAVRLNSTDKEKESASCGFKNTIIFKIISLIFPFFGFILAFFFNKSHKEVSRACLKFAIIGCTASFIFGLVSSGVISQLSTGDYIENLLYENTAECEVKILDCELKTVKTAETTENVFIINYEFTNLSNDEDVSFYTAFLDLVSQNDVILDIIPLEEDISTGTDPFNSIPPNSSTNVKVAYRLQNVYDDVTIEIISTKDNSSVIYKTIEL
jgi:hypothetical protein